MLYTISELHHELFGKVYDVYEVFESFFGERYVDLQDVPDETALKTALETKDIPFSEDESFEISSSQLEVLSTWFLQSRPFILVWWPRVTVTNENDKSIVIQDLYAKIGLTIDGRIPYENRGFQLNRTTYPKSQFVCDYMHSHICSIPIEDFSRFQLPCLGTGPINHTISELKNNNDECEWMLFCQELSMYVTVESLTGGPYRRLETVGSRRINPAFAGYTTVYAKDKIRYFNERYPNALKDFTMYYLKNGHLSFNYQNGKYTSGLSYFDFMVDISNCFIDWFNRKMNPDRQSIQWLQEKYIIMELLAADNRFYSTDSSRLYSDISNYNGRFVCTFKGEAKEIRIIEEEEQSAITTTLLHHCIAMEILTSILRVINFRYSNEHNNYKGQAVTTACQNVRYL